MPWNQTGNIRGPQGTQGIQGIQGVKGDTGNQGIQGVKGDKGDPGAQYLYSRSTDWTNATQTPTTIFESTTLAPGRYAIDILLFFMVSVSSPPSFRASIVCAGASGWRGMADWYTSATAVSSTDLITGITSNIDALPSNGVTRIFRYNGMLFLGSSSTFAVTGTKNAATTATMTVRNGSRMILTPES